MKRIPPLLFVLVFSAAAASSFAQDAAAPLRRSLPTPSEQSPTPTPTPPPEKAPEPTATPVPEPSKTAVAPAAGTTGPPPATTPAARNSPERTSSSSPRVLPEKPLRAVEERSEWARKRPWDNPPQAGAPRRPTFDLSSSSDRNVSPTIRLLEQRWESAIQDHDVATIERLLAQDFVGVSSTGRTASKATLVREMRRDKNVYRKADLRDLSVRTEGNDTAVATGVAQESGTTQDGRPFNSSRRFTDTWVKRNGQWRCIASHATQLP